MSLVAKVPCNVEMEVEAKSKKEALEKALGIADRKIKNGKISEPFWEEMELDINGKDFEKSGSGMYVEEI